MGNKVSQPLSEEVLAALGSVVVALAQIDALKSGVTTDLGLD